VRQALLDSLCLAALGTAAGLLLSRWRGGVLRTVLLPDVASGMWFADGRVLGASVVAATLAGAGAGLAPLLHARQPSLVDSLRLGGGPGASGRFGAQYALVGIQTALCMILVVGAALFVRSLMRVQSQDLGFDASRLLYITLDFRAHLPANERDAAYEAAVDRVRRVEGISRATVVAGIPFGPHDIPPVSVPGVTWPANSQLPIMYGATPDYLAAMQVGLVTGRLIDDRDGRGAPLVALVNETMARTAWPGQSAIGKCLRAGFASFPPDPSVDPSAGTPCREVVGVVRDSRARSLRPDHDEDRLMQYYLPFDQLPDAPFANEPRVLGMIVQTRGDAVAASGAIQRAIQSTAGRQLFARVRPYQSLIDPQLRSWRLGATLFSAMGGLALVIAAAGVVGVVAYLVTQRRREIGVRLALGGTRSMVAAGVIRDALRMTSLGIVIGGVAALLAGPLVASLLFETSPRDAVSVVVAAGVLAVSTVLAAAGPAWRAARVDPAITLRADG
jgi:predicted permease